MSVDLTGAELDRLYEGSKDDRYIVVGSEVWDRREPENYWYVVY